MVHSRTQRNSRRTGATCRALLGLCVLCCIGIGVTVMLTQTRNHDTKSGDAVSDLEIRMFSSGDLLVGGEVFVRSAGEDQLKKLILSPDIPRSPEQGTKIGARFALQERV